MSDRTLPPGYVHLEPLAIVHVATLRQYTNDIGRFCRLLPYARRFDSSIAPGSDEAKQMALELDSCGVDLAELAETVRELGELAKAVADYLRSPGSGPASEWRGPPPLFASDTCSSKEETT